MALTTKQLQQKIKTTSSLKKVTKTMEMVSMAKMNRAIKAVKKSEMYARLALELLARLSKQRDLKHPYLTKRKMGKKLILVIGSDRGLCGAYHLKIEKALRTFIKKFEKSEISNIDFINIGLHGKKICGRLKDLGTGDIIHSASRITSKVTSDYATAIANFIENSFKKDYNEIYVAYNKFISPLIYKTSVVKILPIETEIYAHELDLDHEIRNINPLNIYTLEPNEEAVLDKVLPELINIALYQFILESYASENSARRNSMKTATDSANNMQQALMMAYNQARQESVTTEIIEIINVGQALSV